VNNPRISRKIIWIGAAVGLLLVLLTLTKQGGIARYVRHTASGSYILDLYRNVVPPSPEGNAISYSIFDRSTAWPVEDASARQLLDETRTIKGLEAPDLARLLSVPPLKNTGWSRSGGDEHSRKYSPLARINRDNVIRLAPAWTYHSGGKKWEGNVETNPIVAGDTLFATTPDQFLVALRAADGTEKWRLPLKSPARRGLVWWEGDGTHPPRLFVPSAEGVVAVDAGNGQIIQSFGREGRVGAAASLVAPAVDQGRLLIATVVPAIEAYDAVTGNPLWSRSLLPMVSKSPTPSGRTTVSGGLPWAGFSLDTGRSALYVTTGNPSPALYGVNRPGANGPSSSIVAIDTRTGAIKWSFQEVTHDLWDFDIPSPPVLVTLTRYGLPVDAVAAVTKIGHTILLDRDGGRPLYDYRLRRAPTSRVPGEVTAPYQPDLVLPEPFLRQAFSSDDITDVDPVSRSTVVRKLRGADLGFFVPPAIHRTVATFGLHGGAEWPGAAIDPASGVLYVPSNRSPWVLRLYYRDRQPNDIRNRDRPGDAIYQSQCASCHGVDREGRYEREFVGDTCQPSLVGITADRDLASPDWFQTAHDGITGTKPVSAGELAAVSSYLRAADRISDQRRSLEVVHAWQLLLDANGRPGSKPPWGLISAIDLNTGRTRWSKPFGDYAELRQPGAPPTGQPNFGGLIVTQGGLVFATGTIDRKIRALDATSGEELWSHELPAAGSAPPTTYEINGEQYLVVVASGGVFAGFKERSDTILAFKIGPDASPSMR